MKNSIIFNLVHDQYRSTYSTDVSGGTNRPVQYPVVLTWSAAAIRLNEDFVLDILKVPVISAMLTQRGAEITGSMDWKFSRWALLLASATLS